MQHINQTDPSAFEIKLSDLNYAIRLRAGMDKRTMDEYIKRLLSIKFIEQVDASTFKLNYDEVEKLMV